MSRYSGDGGGGRRNGTIYYDLDTIILYNYLSDNNKSLTLAVGLTIVLTKV